MHKTAMHAELANFHSSQLKTEMDVIDQDQLAIASRDIALMVTLANNAQTTLLLIQETTRTVFQPHNALETINTTELVMLKTATPVEPANFHSSQHRTELDVTDQDQFATASKDTALMDINANNAQTDLLLTQLTTETVSQLQHAKLTTNTLDSVMLKTATPVEPANFHSSQHRTEPDVTDQDQLATVSRDTPTMDTLANNAQTDSLLTQETTNNVFQLQHAKLTTNTSELETPKTAMPVELANFHSSQLKTEMDVIDQDQHVLASRDTLMMDIPAFSAQTDLLLTQETIKPVLPLQLALVITNILVISKTATPVELANFHLSQDKIDQDVIDLDQLAHALKDTVKMVINASAAQLVKLLTTKTLNAFQLQLVLVETKSLVLSKTATDVSNARMV